MSKTIFPEEGFTLSDLLSQEGVTMEVSNDVDNAEEDFEYSKNVFMSNDEILKFLNMEEDNEEEENEEDIIPEAIMPCDISFGKLKKKMTDVLGNGMVMKLIRKEGVGETVPSGSQVSIKYIGYFEYHDEPFDSSYAHGSGPDIFHLGQGEVIPGLEIGVATMKKHEVSVFLIKPEYAYGPLGCLPRIPPNQEVLFAVYLTDFSDCETSTALKNLSLEERNSLPAVKKRALAVMVTANDNFRKEKTRQAIRDYSKVVNMLESANLKNDKEEEEQKKLLSRAYGNLAVCYNKENRPRNACIACQKVPCPNAKSYFHFGRALLRLGEFEKAKEQLWKAKELEPHNKQTIKEIRQADAMHVKYKSSEKRLWSNCLNITKEEQEAKTDFEKATHEMCKSFKSDTNLVRQPLPQGLTPQEDRCVREIAVRYGLSITNHKRHGTEIVFLTKPNY